MKWVWIVVGALVALGLGVAVIGALMPREHRATSEITLRVPPDSVWTVVRDLGGVTAWWPEVRQSERVSDPGGREMWRQTMKNGYAIPLVVEESWPPRRLVTKIAAPPGAAFGGTWSYEIAPADGGSRVRVTEAGWIANPLFRFMSRVVFGYYGTLDSYLKALGRKLGEDVTPLHQS